RPVAESAEVDMGPGESFENGNAARVSRLRATRVDGEVLRARLCPGAAQRAVEQRYAGAFQEPLRLLLHRDGKRARLDHDLRESFLAGELLRHVEERFGRGQR